MIISIIAAVSSGNVIGKKNTLPWYFPPDLKHFKEITMGHTIIMGNKTHESIGKILPGRTNIVLTKNKNFKSEGALIFHSTNEALDYARKIAETETFIIGGASIFEETINLVDRLYLTKIYKKFDGDVYFPKLNLKNWKLVSSESHHFDEGNFDYEFQELDRIKK